MLIETKMLTDAGGNIIAEVDPKTGKPVSALSASVTVTGSRNLTNADNGKILINNSGGAITLTVPSGLCPDFGAGFIQGTVANSTITLSGPAVTLTGATTATSAAGGMLALISIAPDSYVIKAS